MKYLAIYNWTYKHVERSFVAPYETTEKYSDTRLKMVPFESLADAQKCALENKGYVLKLVEVEVTEK